MAKLQSDLPHKSSIEIRKPLSLRQLLLIGVKSYVNAEDLLQDAEVLFANERWARTLYLCCIANEELAKSLISLGAAVRVRLGSFDATQERRYRRRLSRHQMKTATLQAVEDFFWSTRPVTDITQSLYGDSSDIANHERFKLSALYADFDGDGALCPGHVFTAEKVELSLKLARRRMELFRHNVPPMLDLITDCDIAQCQEWMHHLEEII
jgi:AbiV family abortive infection protein